MKITAYCLLIIFYTLQEIHGTLIKEKETAWLKSHAKFRQDFYKFKNKFDAQAAVLIRDYLIYAGLSELVNSFDKCDVTIDRILNTPIYAVSDVTIKKEIDNMDIKDFIRKAQEVFYDSWDAWFGGDCWGDAIGYIEKYGKVSNEVYIDMCADLEHNSGSLFDKGFNIGDRSYNAISALLDKKFKAKSFIYYVNLSYYYELPTEVRKLLLRYANLYIDTSMRQDIICFCAFRGRGTRDDMLNYLMSYEPLKLQGTQKLGDIVDSKQYRIDNGLEDEDYEEDY